LNGDKVKEYVPYSFAMLKDDGTGVALSVGFFDTPL
jgi:hypothetical protein